ncbi:MAG: toll/interleukin-1 receptor domain-containing protein [Rhizomicrobium sp.]
MSFVFISHTGADKPRLRPLIEALWAGGLKVWLDNPAAAGFTAGEVGKFWRIHAGGPWEAEMDEALRKSACVLVCWSRHASDESVHQGRNRLSWMEEAGYARIQKKLVACTIDDVDPRTLPGTHVFQQISNIDAAQEPDRLQAALKMLTDDVAGKMRQNGLGNIEKPRFFRDKFAPYWADRAKQEDMLHDAIAGVAGKGGVRPVFVAAPENERPDEFRERIGRLSSSLLPDEQSWFQLEFDWPGKDVPLRLFTDAYRRNLWRALGKAGEIDDEVIAAALEQKGRPVAVFHCILAREWRIDECQRIQAWLDFWLALAPAARNLPVIPWLQVKMPPVKPGWEDCPRGPSGGIVGNADIWRAVTALQRRLAADGHALGILLPPVLHPIPIGDADRWIDRMQREAGPARRALEEKVRALYAATGLLGGFLKRDPRKYGVNHQTFVDALQPLFDEP